MSGKSDTTNSDPDIITLGVQPKATTIEGIAVEVAAIKLLLKILKTSVDEKLEYGGVIYRDQAGPIKHTGPFKGESAIKVDVGHNKDNWGCPQESTPLAWYHTHPLQKIQTSNMGEVTGLWDSFIGGDKGLSNDSGLTGYLATGDGRVWRYDPPREGGAMVPQKDGRMKWAPPALGKGIWGPLNLALYKR
ncbi:DUF4329 domain-containing protein [Plastoroseomonas hellenica]|uniref:DUF4329 domain-containing protein n=1 Tax=Plastoroseomonas hellenica TaxID=2687306 RepID=UPI001BAE54FF|nr:DUF4329 domain-containing protein [Plastoroseomonas hellenica]MBR0642079.1 DUF4329 domain-containing protein [Plastoroseomonas hellenica]